MATTASTLIHAHGLDETCEQLAPFINIRYVQLERGMACARGAVARMEQLTVGYLGADRHKVEWLDVPRGQMIFLVPMHGRARLGTTGVEPGQAIIAHGPAQLVVCTEREYQSFFVSIPDRSVGTRCTGARLLQASTARLGTFEACAHRAIDTNVAANTLLDVCDTWLREEPGDDLTSPASTARCQAAVRARQYIDEHLDCALTLASVCQASYASPRALEYGFREIYGVSPIAYIRCARLSRVRGELYFSPHSIGKITQLAMKWGFWHLSQFSKDYYDLFGELPSITLGRASGRIDRTGCDCVASAPPIAVAEGL
ncbi:helix-turn-helix domain-containing protein [Peristeroidobacter soli]|uniref:helix-turn-helix domain-containing protein n=1 Tax=Peristeroidobacter soli TaxID=2497877 RepID=UPI0013004EB9|nr:helix-turn-helix domain-containing protein [Peristeroidobacter soli]